VCRGLRDREQPTTPGANKLATTKECRDDHARRSWNKRLMQRQDAEVGGVAKHAKDSG
jgi:hypothetical protein